MAAPLAWLLALLLCLCLRRPAFFVLLRSLTHPAPLPLLCLPAHRLGA